MSLRILNQKLGAGAATLLFLAIEHRDVRNCAQQHGNLANYTNESAIGQVHKIFSRLYYTLKTQQKYAHETSFRHPARPVARHRRKR